MPRLPAWPVARLRAFAAVTITSAAVISFDSIRHLAAIYGFSGLSWMFPLTLDAVAAFGMDLWIRESAAMRSARSLALVAIGLSLVANVADHWISQRSVLAAFLGAVPPAMLAALLAVLHRHTAGPVDSGIAGPAVVVPESVPAAVVLVPDEIRFTVPRSVVLGTPSGPVLVPDLAEQAVPDRSISAVLDGPVHGPVPRKRTASASTKRVAGTISTKVPTDREIVAWIADQAGTTKRSVMTRWSVGSGRALRLMKEATDG
jgi:hypothetical protein